MSEVYTGTWVSIKVGSDTHFASYDYKYVYDSVIGVQILIVDSQYSQ